jgi:hypothetical protein
VETPEDILAELFSTVDLTSAVQPGAAASTTSADEFASVRTVPDRQGSWFPKL